mmetsp:Transcript_22789/g.35697  ORF Transcript_22789/g.35697 Transcript_22789/m.35697 type:complete len:252 (+) Transcript_22789:127-882(+)|eukprot:CAMPEP_0184305418 /NCGR_PEP_ID=MMETSP1049-20130417/14700_1 /TAXON_ID=77928 /ORGANISM="Proteomonas sulcata, Strain CCMP704" /LENGTH=251 /DNA_ID=CAMNT_0026617479 /DNA_START=56 /DNA_END=814 /DNA_ORIENTATION=+
MWCSVCGKEHGGATKLCAACRGPPVCLRCGVELKASSRFCPECGAPAPEEPEAPASDAASAPSFVASSQPHVASQPPDLPPPPPYEPPSCEALSPADVGFSTDWAAPPTNPFYQPPHSTTTEAAPLNNFPPPGTFTVRLPPSARPGDILEVIVPPGLPQSGQKTRFAVPPSGQAGGLVYAPLPHTPAPAMQPPAGDCPPGLFKVVLPWSAVPGQTMQVMVPPPFSQQGMTTKFVVPPGSKPGGIVYAPLPK